MRPGSRVTAGLSRLAFAGFVAARTYQSGSPLCNCAFSRNRNFGVGTLITTLYGFALYGVTAMLPLFLQTPLGYSALDSGLAVSPRGLGSMLAMIVVGILVNYVDGRILLACGFGVFGYSTVLLSHINLGISMWSVAMPNFLNGFAGGFIFVPLTTMTMGLLRKQEIGNAAGIYNLMRNIGGSIGIATVTTFLVRGSQIHQNYLGAGLSRGKSNRDGHSYGPQAKFSAGGADGFTRSSGGTGRSLQ